MEEASIARLIASFRIERWRLGIDRRSWSNQSHQAIQLQPREICMKRVLRTPDIRFLSRKECLSLCFSFVFHFFCKFYTRAPHFVARRQKATIHWRDLIINSSCSPIIAYYYFSSDIRACKHICLMICIRCVEIYLKLELYIFNINTI